MRVIVDKDRLQKSLAAASKSVARNNIMPIINGYKLEATEGKLVVTATDMETSLEITVEAEVFAEGTLVMPRLFADSIKEMPGGNLELIGEGQALKVVYGLGNELRLNGFDPEQFPALPTLAEAANTVQLPGPKFREIVNTVSYAASSDSNPSRVIFTALVLDFAEDGLWTVTTDSHRMAAYHLTDQAFEFKGKLLLPAAKMNDLVRLTGEGDIAIRFDGKNCFFDLGIGRAWVRMLGGEFFNYRPIIQGFKANSTVSLKRTELLAAVNRGLNLVSSDKAMQFLQLKLEGNMLILDCKGEMGAFHEQVTVQEVSGEIKQVAMNPHYLREALAVLTEEQVTLQYSGEKQPILVKPSENYTAVILPITIRSSTAAA